MIGGPPDTYWDDPVARGDVCDECGNVKWDHAEDCPLDIEREDPDQQYKDTKEEEAWQSS